MTPDDYFREFYQNKGSQSSQPIQSSPPSSQPIQSSAQSSFSQSSQPIQPPRQFQFTTQRIPQATQVQSQPIQSSQSTQAGSYSKIVFLPPNQVARKKRKSDGPKEESPQKKQKTEHIHIEPPNYCPGK